MSKPKLLFFTGAGISAESGLQTFRDSKYGLWNNFKIEDVCTPSAWEKNPSLVLDFYNQRRKQCKEAKPNLAHELIAKLETKKIVLSSVKENINLNTAFGKHSFRNYVNTAQYESELISERVKNSIKYRKANNIHIGKVPYGYKIENRKLVKRHC